MAIGIILVDLAGGYKADLSAIYFGSILTVSSNDLLVMFVFRRDRDCPSYLVL